MTVVRPRSKADPRSWCSASVVSMRRASARPRYLVQGFRLELTACLVRFREWIVRDEPIVDAGRVPDRRGIGEFIIDASAFETSNALRLVLMLRDAHKNEYLWSERIGACHGELVRGATGVVRRIATALDVHLSLERLSAIVSKPATDLGAYDLWLQGQTLLTQLNPTAWKNGLDILQKVVERDPDFAPAYCGVANANNMIQLSLPGVFRERRRTETAMSFAKKAVHVDPSSSRTQLAWLGRTLCLGNQSRRRSMRLWPMSSMTTILGRPCRPQTALR